MSTQPGTSVGEILADPRSLVAGRPTEEALVWTRRSNEDILRHNYLGSSQAVHHAEAGGRQYPLMAVLQQVPELTSCARANEDVIVFCWVDCCLVP